MVLRIASRSSELALWQANHVASLVAAHTGSNAAETEVVEVTTKGDRRTDVPLWTIGGKGVFVSEVRAAVLDGRADAAVHSAKDVPAAPVDGLTIAAIPVRGNPFDVLVGSSVADLAPGARVATGSARRRVQLSALRPDLTFTELRGNMATRLAKVDDGLVVVAAAAALERLGLELERVEQLSPSVMLPQVGQGALLVECRSDDEQTKSSLAAIDDEQTRGCVAAERAFLHRLGGDCSLPVGAYATRMDRAGLELTAMIASLDGHALLRHRLIGSDPSVLGAEVATELMASGGEGLLDG